MIPKAAIMAIDIISIASLFLYSPSNVLDSLSLIASAKYKYPSPSLVSLKALAFL